MESPTPPSHPSVPPPSSSSSSSGPLPPALDAEEGVEELTLVVKWSGREYMVRVCGDDSVAELKRRICEATNVLPKRQKLLYPKLATKLSDDSIFLCHLPLKPSVKMTMIGTVEDDIIVDQVDAPEVIDDFELGQDEVTDIKDKEVNKQKLRRRVNQYKEFSEVPDMIRKDFYPGWDLHEFLSAVYAEYDIIIWSATSMKWVELKMGQLGVLSNPNYKITALLDHLAMITVQSDSHGIFECKPLGLIWGQFPEVYNSKNTIMFDDLRRNFVMNPQNGLIIKPFRKAHLNRGTDQELMKLTRYLLAIAELDDLSLLDHGYWESYAEDSTKR
ncbi:Ubiquitin-like domain-containing CTD phosphatase [Acorus calamus]|uniref:protein-serine/threonine phosphatase n=1 Tax=Acorus calamus TaxID=4465 RepID=A0AAV9F6Z7_ACOCL|nr:Ubiquitin-like domain-containing CTD phosphatase [Acorus calamus]